jgi:hypothetical protein
MGSIDDKIQNGANAKFVDNARIPARVCGVEGIDDPESFSINVG